MPRAPHIDRFGSYEVVRRLGSGGMAEVHLAIQRMASGVERPVVLKSILPHLAQDAKFVRMFLREARIAAMLSHPNVVQIIDVQEIEGLPCIVMECLRGRDLWAVLRVLAKRGERATAEEVAAVGAQAARGLEYAHQLAHPERGPLGLVHRDISPHNLFLTREGYVRILDFGIAKIDDETKTQQSTLKGKIAYMAPEQARALPLDGRADQFALGVVLWELLAGQRLFYRGDPVQTLTALFDDPIPALAELEVSAPAGLEDVLRRMLSREREDRFPSCAEVADALRAVLAGAARGEEACIAGLLARAVPPEEDEGYYGLDASGRRTRDIVLPADRGDDEEDTGEVLGPWTSARAAEGTRSPERTRSVVPASARLPRAVDASDTPVVTAPPSSGRSRVVLGLGVAILAAAGGVGVAIVGSLPRGTPPDDARVAPEAPASPPPSAPPVARLWLDSLPAGARIEVDGAPHDGALPIRVERDRRHAVRVLEGGVEVWRWQGLVTGEELRLPVTPARSTAVAMPSEPTIEPDAPRLARRSRDEAPHGAQESPAAQPARGDEEPARADEEPAPVEPRSSTRAEASPAEDEPASAREDEPARSRRWTRDRALEIETEYP